MRQSSFVTAMARSAPVMAGLALTAALSLAIPAAAEEPDMWPGIAKDIFGAREMAVDDGTLTLEAPCRAEAAALVPLTVRIPESVAASVKKLTLVIDKNPAPMAAAFTFGPAAGTGERVISTRVRFDMYSSVHAVAETADGKLHMVTKFVKAAGGCSAPALKDADEALASIGKVQVRTFETAGLPAEAQVMIRHPNYSGMQMNQLTGLYIPAKFVDQMTVKRGDELVFELESGISLSEDPNIRFSFNPGKDDTISVSAKDNTGATFSGRSTPKGS